MKVNKWTLGLAAVGLVTLPSVSQAEEKVSPLGTALSSTTISGYVNTSARWDLGSGSKTAGSGNNPNAPAYGYGGGKADGFNLDAVLVRIQKPLDEAQWAAGYTVDFLLGADAGALGQAAPSQAYVQLRAPVGNGLDFKVGLFDTIIGYESYHAGNNPNYSRSYGNTIEPTQHTGVLASYQFSDLVTASFGIANTFGPGIGGRAGNSTAGTVNESYKTYMASIALTAPESFGFAAGSTLYLGAINGFNAGTTAGVGANQSSLYVGSTLNTPVKGLKVGASFDYVSIHKNSAVGVGLPSPGLYANAAALYASYQATEKLSLHTRGEYASHSKLSGTAGAVGGYTPGNPTKVLALTETIQYDLWANVISRLELRWDHQASGGTSGTGAALKAFGNTSAGVIGSKKNNFSVAANIIYKF